jgi:hypothetical protein
VQLRKKKAPEITLQWHPNFRVTEALPDIKPVRTGFLVNSVAVTLAVMALAFLLYVTVQIISVNRVAAKYQATIDEAQKENAKYLNLSAAFFKDSKRLQDVTKFYGPNVSPVQLLNTIAEARPENIWLETVQLNPYNVEPKPGQRVPTQQLVVTGTITGESKDLESLDSFVKKIISAPVLKERIADPIKDPKIDPPRREGPSLFKFSFTVILKPV